MGYGAFFKIKNLETELRRALEEKDMLHEDLQAKETELQAKEKKLYSMQVHAGKEMKQKVLMEKALETLISE